MRDLQEFKASSVEEFAQFALAEFFLAGSFWVAVERFFTIENPWNDVLFWICLVSVIASAIIGWAGWRQLLRKYRRIDSIIESAREQARKRENADAT